MAEVLGTLSFLDTPDVNGVLILTETTGVTSVAGTINQIDITGTVPNFVVGLAIDPILPGTGSLTLPSGTTAQRPVIPAAGMSRFNSTIGKIEYYTGAGWVPTGSVIQTVVGTITKVSSNVQIPYDTTIPTSTEGIQLWSQSFTPILATSTILITTNSFYIINSSNDVIVSGATFNNTTNINTQVLGFGTTTGAGNQFNVTAIEISGSVTARTYSFRAGPGSAVTIFYGRGVTATFGAANTGNYIITEIA